MRCAETSKQCSRVGAVYIYTNQRVQTNHKIDTKIVPNTIEKSSGGTSKENTVNAPRVQMLAVVRML